ncbi:MAG TPA: hypothetical protein VJ910_15170 [Desulfuromonadales bacterium]|nr:hypothetical protein [Desulfuromonadales bacterium]
MAGNKTWLIAGILFAVWMMVPTAASARTAQLPGQGLAGQLFVLSDNCLACHNDLITSSGANVSIGANWQSSMMAHSSRDPYWQASVRRETIDHPASGSKIQDECAACHMPMARYQAKRQGGMGKVFNYLPILSARGQQGQLAADAVSCSMCHQIQSNKLGTQASFNAGFEVDGRTPLGQRSIYGPFQIDPGRTRLMQSATRMTPTEAAHIQRSELCGSCHTLYTHARGADGAKVGTLPEQMPYLEWRHSAYPTERSCQSCHMPVLDQPMAISGPLGKDRQGFSQHVFRGGNFFMPKIFNRYRTELGVTALPQDLVLAAHETTRHLQENAARIEILQAQRSAEGLQVGLSLTNLAGHKLPTAYPSRRSWIHLTVSDRNGQVIFESGALNPDGSIVGNDNDSDPQKYEPHHARINNPQQVQVYEAIMADSGGNVTTGLISAVRFIKDNRIPPRGFDKDAVPEDVAVQGKAFRDADFQAGQDEIRYSIPLEGQGPYMVEAELWYQPIAFRWARNLAAYQAAEARRFVAYYQGMADQSAVRLARDQQFLE